MPEQVENIQFLSDLSEVEGQLERIADALESLVEILQDIYGPPVMEL